MDVHTRQTVAGGILTTFPSCPAEVIEDLLAALEAPLGPLVEAAQITLDKPYGTNRILRHSGEYGVSFAQIQPERSTSLHYHTRRREFFCVRQGVLTLTSGDSTRQLGRFEFGSSIPGQPHALANADAEVLEILEIFSPPLLDDKVRLRDRYHRTLGAVGLHQ